MSRPARTDGELIHDAAGNAGEAVFRPLADEGAVHDVLGGAGETLDREGRGGLQGGAAAETGAGGKVGLDDGVESGRVDPGVPVSGENADEVIEPELFGESACREIAQVDRGEALFGKGRCDADEGIGSWSGSDLEGSADRGGQDPAIEVVHVLADEVDATGRLDGEHRWLAESRPE